MGRSTVAAVASEIPYRSARLEAGATCPLPVGPVTVGAGPIGARLGLVAVGRDGSPLGADHVVCAAQPLGVAGAAAVVVDDRNPLGVVVQLDRVPPEVGALEVHAAEVVDAFARVVVEGVEVASSWADARGGAVAALVREGDDWIARGHGPSGTSGKGASLVRKVQRDPAELAFGTTLVGPDLPGPIPVGAHAPAALHEAWHRCYPDTEPPPGLERAAALLRPTEEVVAVEAATWQRPTGKIVVRRPPRREGAIVLTTERLLAVASEEECTAVPDGGWAPLPDAPAGTARGVRLLVDGGRFLDVRMIPLRVLRSDRGERGPIFRLMNEVLALAALRLKGITPPGWG